MENVPKDLGEVMKQTDTLSTENFVDDSFKRVSIGSFTIITSGNETKENDIEKTVNKELKDANI